jgi:hypothetical protein
LVTTRRRSLRTACGRTDLRWRKCHSDAPRLRLRGSDDAVASASARRVYLSLLGITLMNPTTVIYFAAPVLGNRTTAVTTPVDQAVFPGFHR